MPVVHDDGVEKTRDDLERQVKRDIEIAFLRR